MLMNPRMWGALKRKYPSINSPIPIPRGVGYGGADAPGGNLPDPGLWAADQRIYEGTTIPQTPAPVPSRGAAARAIHHGQMMGPNYGIGSPYVLEAGGNAAINAAMARQASQTQQTPQYDYTMDASAGSPAKKKSNKLKYIVEALQEMEGEAPEKLAMGRGYGRAMPAAQGFSLASMGGKLGEQEAMAKARREEELRRRMKLMGGGY